MRKITVVTYPDFYFMDQPSVLSFGYEYNNTSVCNCVKNVDIDITVYLATAGVDINWLVNVSNNVDYILLNTEVDNLITGLLVDKPKTYYYNNSTDFNIINKQQIEDPVAFLVGWLAKLED